MDTQSTIHRDAISMDNLAMERSQASTIVKKLLLSLKA